MNKKDEQETATTTIKNKINKNIQTKAMTT